MKLTKEAVAALAMPPGKTDHFEWDDDLPSFGVRLRGRTKKLGDSVPRQRQAAARKPGRHPQGQPGGRPQDRPPALRPGRARRRSGVGASCRLMSRR